MKIPSLTFPTEHVNNIMTLAAFLRKPTWSKTYLQIMIKYKSKKLYFTNQLYGRCQYFTVAYHILVRQVPWKYGYLPFRKANIMNILTSAAFCRDQHNRKLPIFFLNQKWLLLSKIYTAGVSNMMMRIAFQCGNCHEITVACLSQRYASKYFNNCCFFEDT